MSSAVFAILKRACMAFRDGDWECGGYNAFAWFNCVLRKLRVLFPCFLKIGRNFWLEFIQLRLYLFRTTWIIDILFWLFNNFWELILNSLKLPSLLICFLSFSCSLMLCRHVLTSLFYFIVRIFLFCVCLYMYVCIYTSWITYI